jgi:hypothetical protein
MGINSQSPKIKPRGVYSTKSKKIKTGKTGARKTGSIKKGKKLGRDRVILSKKSKYIKRQKLKEKTEIRTT